MGDLAPVMANLQLPWVPAYDTNPIISIEEKNTFLGEAVDKNITLFFEHDLYNECCRVENTDKGIKATKSFALEEFLETS